jgi:hypothetical protein
MTVVTRAGGRDAPEDPTPPEDPAAGASAVGDSERAAALAAENERLQRQLDSLADIALQPTVQALTEQLQELQRANAAIRADLEAQRTTGGGDSLAAVARAFENAMRSSREEANSDPARLDERHREKQQQLARLIVKPQPPPKFSATEQELNLLHYLGWENVLRQYVDYPGLDDDVAAHSLAQFLDGNALAWYQALGTERPKTVDGFFAALRDRFFVGVDTRQKAMENALRVKQGSDSVHKFVERLETWLRLAGITDEERHRDLFLVGLSKAARQRYDQTILAIRATGGETNLPYKTVKDIVLRREAMEAQQAPHSRPKSSKAWGPKEVNVRGVTQASSTPQFVPHGLRKVARQYNISDELLATRFASRACVICGKQDHRASACPRASPSGGARKAQKQVRFQDPNVGAQ